ncbi:hypothetical protein BDF20DRAFT_102969 [Mycotypha africana]|uniref:uncharacterized protein n=1 Tax=Mycotypha africana TaxID=64632 RepID=UPI00230192CB|nr:uncharacterized protein BDF20DRAFT_102969 [Mycotypha africana]KAI8970085.1 hypothetical protein BDF20DRAFT_102969 [Mycotypha africana]
MSSTSPQHSLSSPATTINDNNAVLPTPTSSTSVNLRPFNGNSNANGNNNNNTNLLQKKKELEQQISEKQKLLEESSSGIGKNVLARQITQLQNKIQEIEDKINNGENVNDTLSEPLSASSSSSSMEKLRSLERDVANYKAHPLSPGISSIRNKEKLLNQRSSPSTSTDNSGDPLPSPSASTLLPPHIAAHQHNLHHYDSPSSLLPLPPPPTGSTPTKRRSKVPTSDRRNTDIEFATEIGQGLLLEVRKMQALLQEKEEKLRTLEIQKADLERAAEAMAKQMRQREENEEKLKEETWNLELAKQELVISVTELQSNLTKATAEQTKLAKQVNDLRAEIEQLRDREEKLTATIEDMKQRHEQDMTSIRRHTAAIQREKADQTKQIETLTSELAIAKAQSRIGKHASIESELNSRAGQTGNQTDSDQTKSTAAVKDDRSPTSSPPSSPKLSPARNQAMEVETLKTSLAHAHRMVSNLRSNLHKEKTEKFELKKLLAESQETIEQLQNDPRMWVDAGPIRNGGSSSNGYGRNNEDTGRRSHKASTTASSRRRAKKMSMTTATARNARMFKGQKSNSNNISDTDSVYSYSSVSSENSEENEFYDESDAAIDVTTNTSKRRPRSSSIVSNVKKQRQCQQQQQQQFTPLSSELSQSLSKPVLVDAEVMTDPIDLYNTASFKDISREKSYNQEQSSNQYQKVRTLEDELGMATQNAQQSPPFIPIAEKNGNTSEQSDSAVAGAVTMGMGNLLEELTKSSIKEVKTGVEMAIQTDIQPGSEMSTQTDLFEEKGSETVDVLIQTDEIEEEPKPPKAEIAIQTQAPDTAEISVQTGDELTPAVFDVCMQTDAEIPLITNEISTQTDEEEKPTTADVSMQTETAEISETFIQTDPELRAKTAEISIQTDVQVKSCMLEASMQTDPEFKPEIVEVSIQTDSELKPETMDIVTQTDAESKPSTADNSTQTEQEESIIPNITATAASIAAVATTVNGNKITTPNYLEASVQTDTRYIVESTVEFVEMAIQTDDEPFVETFETFAQIEKLEQKAESVNSRLDATEIAERDETLQRQQFLNTSSSNAARQAAEDPSATTAALTTSISTSSSSVAGAVDEETQCDLAEFKPLIVDQATQSEEVSVVDRETQYVSVDSMNSDVGNDAKKAVDALIQCDTAQTRDFDVQCENVETKDAGVQYVVVEEQTHDKLNTKTALGSDLLAYSPVIKKDVRDPTDIAPGMGITNTRFKKEIADKDADNNSDVFYEAEENYGNVIVHLPAETVNSAFDDYYKSSKHLPVELSDGPTVIHQSAPKGDEVRSRDTLMPVISRINDLPATIEVKTPYLSFDAKDSTISSDISESDIPPRPSNPPPAALLEKAGRLSILGSDAQSSVATLPSAKGNRSLYHPNLSTEILDQQQQLQVAPASPDSPLPHQQLVLEKGNTITSVLSSSTENTNEQLQSVTSSNDEPNGNRGNIIGNEIETTIPQSLTSSSTDPRIINMITQTMIGDWLWKYTRKTMGSGISENRHQRYFWIHPYSLTLYWSTNAPGVDLNEAKAKSALIENIKTVSDHNLNHNDLPNVSLLIQTSYRQLKITAPTIEKHELWLASISYLLDRVEQGSTAGLTLLRNANRKIDTMGGSYTTKSISSSLNNGGGSSTSGSLFTRPNFRRIQEIFHYPSISTTSNATARSSFVANRASASADHIGLGSGRIEAIQDDDEAIEDVRMCCNGKHHVSKLEKTHNHQHHNLHHNYRKRKSLRRGRSTVKTIG